MGRHAAEGRMVPKPLIILALAGSVLVLTLQPAWAGLKTNTGGNAAAYVSSDSCDPLQDNSITSNDDIFVNLGLGPTDEVTLTFAIYDNGTSLSKDPVAGPFTFYAEEQCDETGIWWVDLGSASTLLGENSGSYTLVVYYGSELGGKNFGRNSFLYTFVPA